MRKTWAIVIVIGILLGCFSFQTATANDPKNLTSIKTFGSLPPLRTFHGPSFLYSDGFRIFVVEEPLGRVQSLFQQNDYQLYQYGRNNGLFTKPGGVTTYQSVTYLTDNENNKILTYSRTGAFDKEFTVKNPDGKQQLANPYGICSYQGRLYIANTGAGNIIVCDVTGKYAATIGQKGAGDGELSKPTGVCVSGDKLFVTDPSLSRISVFSLDGKFVSNFGSGSPWAITSHENRIYVTDNVAGRVNVYGADGASVTSFGSPGSGQGQLGNPKGITILDGKCYVSSFTNNRVDIFELDGKHVGILGLPVEQAAASFGRPTGLAIAGDNLIISDAIRNKIITYKLQGNFVSEFGSFGSGDKQLTSPGGVAADTSGNIYVADTGNNCVKVFDNAGSFKRVIGSNGSGNGKLNAPGDVAVASSVGKLFVSDTGNNLVQIFSLSGEFLGQFGGFGNAPGQFNNPMGIATDGRKILVADAANCRIQEFTIDGKPVRSFGHKGRGKDMLLYPTDCNLDESGKIYVTDTYNHRVVVFDSRTNFSWVFGSNGSQGNFPVLLPATCEPVETNKKALGFFNFPYSIVVGDSGCFVADTENHRIQNVDFEMIFGDSNYLVSPTSIDFGVIPQGGVIEDSVQLMNISGGALSGIIQIPPDAKWLKTHVPAFSNDEEKIVFYADTSGLEAGTYEAVATLISNKDGDREPKKINFKIQVGDAYGYTIDVNPIEIRESSNRIDVVVTFKGQNGYNGSASVTVGEGSTPKGTYIKWSESLLTLSKKTDTIMTIQSSSFVSPGIYNITIVGETPKLKFKIRRDFKLIVTKNFSLESRLVLGETFTAVWCQYCPYAHRAADRLIEEYGNQRVVWLNYYVDSKNDEASLYEKEADKRYRWYPGQGLPTTFFDGINSIIGGDNNEERTKPPKDRLPCDKFSGTTFTYKRYLAEVERRMNTPSPLSIFLDQKVTGNTLDLGVEIETLATLGNTKNLALYVVLSESNIPFIAVNGDEVHNLVSRVMYTGGAGEPISLVEGQTFYKKMQLKIPDYVDKNNANVIVWVQNNASKEIFQAANVNLYEQTVEHKYSVLTQRTEVKTEVDKESDFNYFITNTSTHAFDLNCSPQINAKDWEYTILVDGKEQKTEQFKLSLKPMESTVVSFRTLAPEGAQPGLEASFNLVTSTSPIDGKNNVVKVLTIPRRPPDYTFESPLRRIELTAGAKAEFKVQIDPINDFDGPVSISNCTDNPQIKVSANPPTGIPPFTTTVTVEGSTDLQISEYKVCLVATGTPNYGGEVTHRMEIPIDVQYARLELESKSTKIISCSENQSCHSAQIDIRINTPIEVNESRFSIRYDPKVLTISHTNLGDFFAGKDANYDFIDRSSEGIATVIIKSTTTKKGNSKLFSVVVRGVKGVTKLGSQIEVCDTQMYGERGSKVLTNIGCAVINMDVTSQIPPPIVSIDIKDEVTLDQEIIVIKGVAKSSDPQYPVRLTINGKQVTLDPIGNFEFEAPLREGKNTFIIIAIDESGGATGVKKTVYRDSTPPTIGLVDIDETMTVNTPVFTVKGWVDEDSKVTVEGQEMKLNEYREFEWSINLKDGLNKITITATDNMGKTSTKTLSITLKMKTIILLWLGKKEMNANGKIIELATAPTSSSPPLPKAFAGNTFMPIADVAKALGVKVGWDAKERRVDLTQTFLNGKTKLIQLWINGKNAKIDGKPVPIDSKGKLYPTIVEGKTLLPLRFVGEALSCQVEYEAKEKRITLTYQGQ